MNPKVMTIARTLLLALMCSSTIVVLLYFLLNRGYGLIEELTHLPSYLLVSLISIPVLFVLWRFTEAKRRSPIRKAAMAAIAIFLVLQYGLELAEQTVSIHFLVNLWFFGLSLAYAAYLLVHVSKSQFRKWHIPGTSRKLMSVFLIVSAVILLTNTSISLVDALYASEDPISKIEWIFILTILVPLLFITGQLVLQKKAWGYFIAYTLLFYFLLSGIYTGTSLGVDYLSGASSLLSVETAFWPVCGVIAAGVGIWTSRKTNARLQKTRVSNREIQLGSAGA